MPINRRELMSGAAIAAAASAMPLGFAAGTAKAAEMGKPAGVFSYKLGDMECLALNDGVANFPLPDGFVKNASTQEVGDALARALMGREPGDVVAWRLDGKHVELEVLSVTPTVEDVV